MHSRGHQSRDYHMKDASIICAGHNLPNGTDKGVTGGKEKGRGWVFLRSQAKGKLKQ